MEKTNSALIKLDFVTEQTVGEITKIIGTVNSFAQISSDILAEV